MPDTLSPEEWANREGMRRSTVYYLLTKSKRKRLPHIVENRPVIRIPSNITKKDIVNVK